MQLYKITKLGHFFLAIPMVVFGIQHFLYAQFVSLLVPSWIPAPLFWTYFTGTALFAAGLGIIANVWSRVAAALLGMMISVWVVILHIPRAFADTGDRELINIFDALFILSGAFLLSEYPPRSAHLRKISAFGAKAAPFLIAISITVFGVKHFLNGQLVFIVGADYYKVPGAIFWVYLSGIVFILCALVIVFGKWSALISALLGIFILVITLLFYGTQLLSNLYDGHTWTTFLKGIAMSGSAFILANAMAMKELQAAKETAPA